MNKRHIILDPGHADYDIENGKYSPKLTPELGYDEETCFNGRFREGMFNRRIVEKLTDMFTKLGFVVRNTSPESGVISLAHRVKRANAWVKEFGKENCIFISIHSNAAPSNDGWEKARGTSVHTCNGCSKMSEKLARSILEAAVNDGFKGNRSNGFCKNNFYVVKNTICPAVLVENLFYNNKEDIKILMSDEGREKIAQYIFKGICNALN